MIEVTLVYAPAPRQVFEQSLTVVRGATVRDVVLASALGARFPQLDWPAMTPGIWGAATRWDQLVKEHDRIELCRLLCVDPKVARRERFRRQGARATGLFAKRRDGGKPGY